MDASVSGIKVFSGKEYLFYSMGLYMLRWSNTSTPAATTKNEVTHFLSHFWLLSCRYQPQRVKMVLPKYNTQGVRWQKMEYLFNHWKKKYPIWSMLQWVESKFFLEKKPQIPTPKHRKMPALCCPGNTFSAYRIISPFAFDGFGFESVKNSSRSQWFHWFATSSTPSQRR